jgi:hypothetical protein
MRRRRLWLALGVLFAVGLLTLRVWYTVIHPDSWERAIKQIEPGMTLDQVQWLLLSEGEHDWLAISGEISVHEENWRKYGFPMVRRWENTSWRVRVTFTDPTRGIPVVTDVSTQRKDPPSIGALRQWRLGLGLLWVFAFCLLVRALQTPKPIRATLPPLRNDDPGVSWANSRDAEGTSCP